MIDNKPVPKKKDLKRKRNNSQKKKQPVETFTQAILKFIRFCPNKNPIVIDLLKDEKSPSALSTE